MFEFNLIIVGPKGIQNKVRALSFIYLFVTLGVIFINVVISQLVGVGVGCDDTKEVTKLLLLQVLLSQIFQVSLEEWGMSLNLDSGSFS